MGKCRTCGEECEDIEIEDEEECHLCANPSECCKKCYKRYEEKSNWDKLKDWLNEEFGNATSLTNLLPSEMDKQETVTQAYHRILKKMDMIELDLDKKILGELPDPLEGIMSAD